MLFADAWSWLDSAPLMLAAMATLGYVFGRRRPPLDLNPSTARSEVARALAVARELEAVAERLQSALGAQVPAVMKFNARLKRMERTQNLSWQELCDRADELLKPALRLSTEVSHAYAAIVQQMTHLTTFAELRIDPLTGVCNRRSFDDSLRTLIAQHARSGETFALAMIDIDHFKRVNDERGHLQGDQVLQDVAQCVRSCLRPNDVVARYGGEEFVMLFPRTDLATACNLSERTRAAIAANTGVTASLGLAVSLPDDTSDTLLARADAALYMAKGEGRNCVYFHEGLPARIVGIRVSDSCGDSGVRKPRLAAPPVAVVSNGTDADLTACLPAEAS